MCCDNVPREPTTVPGNALGMQLGAHKHFHKAPGGGGKSVAAELTFTHKERFKHSAVLSRAKGEVNGGGALLCIMVPPWLRGFT